MKVIALASLAALLLSPDLSAVSAAGDGSYAIEVPSHGAVMLKIGRAK